jgi:hypothetical protein
MLISGKVGTNEKVAPNKVAWVGDWKSISISEHQ